MEFAEVLLVLWRRRRWIAVGSVLVLYIALSTGYKVGLLPPKLTPKALAVGTADTTILVDTQRSALNDLGKSVEALSLRANVYAPFMTSEPVRQAIATRLGVPLDAIVTSAPVNPNGTLMAQEPTAARRSQQILAEHLGYRLTFTADPGQPTITISSQAPRVADALRLANGAAAAFSSYVRSMEANQHIPPSHRAVIRQLGPAEGGLIGGEVKHQLVAVTFVGGLIGWMVLVVFLSNLADRLREIRQPDSALSSESSLEREWRTGSALSSQSSLEQELPTELPTERRTGQELPTERRTGQELPTERRTGQELPTELPTERRAGRDRRAAQERRSGQGRRLNPGSPPPDESGVPRERRSGQERRSGYERRAGHERRSHTGGTLWSQPRGPASS